MFLSNIHTKDCSKLYCSVAFSLLMITGCGGSGSDDAGGDVGGDTIVVNTPPSVNAGEDGNSDELSAVTLSSVASDSDGIISSYSWTQTAGTSVAITNSSAHEASFISPSLFENEVLTFQVTVTDNDGDTATDEVSYTIMPVGLKVLSLTSAPISKPNHIIQGNSGTISAYEDFSGNIKQMLYESEDSAIRTRIIYDTSTHEPTKIIDELTGDYVEMIENGANRIDIYQFNASGNYLSGRTIFLEDGNYYTADILGTPAFEGQISGQLNGGSQTGSFALVADQTTTLSNVTLVDSKIVEMMDAIANSGTANKSSIAKSAVVFINGEAIAKALSIGQALKWGGVIVGGLAVAGTLAPAYAAAGAMMIIAGFSGNEIGTYIDNNFQSDEPFVQEMIDIVVDNLHAPDETSISDIWTSIKDKFNDGIEFISDISDKAKNQLQEFNDIDLFEEAVNTAEEVLDDFLIPDSTETPPEIEVDVTGQAVLQDGTVFSLDGTVDEDGNLTVSGDNDDATDNIDIIGSIDELDDSVDGSFSTNTESGTVDAQTESLGQCSTSTGSGGQGTFTYAHYVGASAGYVDFEYDSYSIPDQFTVRTSDGVQFDTGGLVSGSETIAVYVVDSTVFVSVSAPNSGTAWEYNIGCIE